MPVISTVKFVGFSLQQPRRFMLYTRPRDFMFAEASKSKFHALLPRVPDHILPVAFSDLVVILVLSLDPRMKSHFIILSHWVPFLFH